MMQYSRLGLYDNLPKIKDRKKAETKSTDWVNIFLFILLVIVIVLFIVT